MHPTFDVNEQVASVVFSHVRDVRTRVALAQVNTAWHKASKVASSLPTSLDFTGCPVTDWEPVLWRMFPGGCIRPWVQGVLDLPDAHFHALLEQAGADLSDRKSSATSVISTTTRSVTTRRLSGTIREHVRRLSIVR